VVNIPTTDPRPAAVLRKRKGLYTLREVGAAAGMAPSTFHDLVSAGHLPAPSLVLVRRRYYTATEAEQVLQMIQEIRSK